MLYFDRIDVSEGIDVNMTLIRQTNQKSAIFSTISIF